MGNAASTSVCQTSADEGTFHYTGLAVAAGLLFALPITIMSFVLSLLRLRRMTNPDKPPTLIETLYSLFDIGLLPTPRRPPGGSGEGQERLVNTHAPVAGGLLTLAVLIATAFVSFWILAAGFTSPGAKTLSVLPATGHDAGSLSSHHLAYSISFPCAPDPRATCLHTPSISGPGQPLDGSSLNGTCVNSNSGLCTLSGIRVLSGQDLDPTLHPDGTELVFTLFDTDVSASSHSQVALSLGSPIRSPSALPGGGYETLQSLNSGGQAVFADSCLAYWGLSLPETKSFAYRVEIPAAVRRRCEGLSVFGPRMVCGGSNSFNAPSPYSDSALAFDAPAVDTRDLTGSLPSGTVEVALLFSPFVLNTADVSPPWELALPQILGTWAFAAVFVVAMRLLLHKLYLATALLRTSPASFSRFSAMATGLGLGVWYGLVVDGLTVVVWYVVSYPGYSALRPGNNINDLSRSITLQAVPVAFAVRALIRTLFYVLVFRIRFTRRLRQQRSAHPSSSPGIQHHQTTPLLSK